MAAVAVHSIAVIARDPDAAEGLAGAVKGLKARGASVRIEAVSDDVSAVALAQKVAERAKDEGTGAIVAAGGDGTVNEVINGVFQPSLEYTYGVGVVPLGTANDFARQCGVPLDDSELALDLVAAGHTERIDLGRMNGRLYANMALAGFMAELSSDTSPVLKKALGPAAYVLHGLTNAGELSARKMKITTPGRQWEGNAYLLVVGNGAEFGGGSHLSATACINDGLLDVAIVPEVGLTQLAAIGQWVVRGGDLNKADGVVFFQAPWVDVESEGLQLNLDGQPFAGETFHFDVVERGLPFFMREEPRPGFLK